PAYPFRLNTGRIRDQWHTMTRSGRSPRLGVHSPEPFVEIGARDAARIGLADGDFARVTTQHSACIVKVSVSEGQRPHSLFMPIHWSGETASDSRVGELVSAETDPYSGQPEMKATPATVTRVDFARHGFARVHSPLSLPPRTWWSRAETVG